MKLLAFETATEACSVALWIDGAVRERFEIAPRRHAELALPWADQLLAEAGITKSQLDAIAVGRGPGAFTGVRLAVALAQGIALALDRPVVPVSTLAVLACADASSADTTNTVGDEVRILAAIDARMGEVYAATFVRSGGGLVATSQELVAAPDAVALADAGEGWIGVGTGFSALDGRLRTRLQDRFARIDATALPHAADVARLAVRAFERGESVAAEQLQPAYLRDNVALTLQQQAASRG